MLISMISYQSVSIVLDWAILEAGKTGGGGAIMAPHWDLGRGSRDRRKNLHSGSVCVRCNLQDRVFKFSKIFFFYFILINYANLCKKSDFLL